MQLYGVKPILAPNLIKALIKPVKYDHTEVSFARLSLATNNRSDVRFTPCIFEAGF